MMNVEVEGLQVNAMAAQSWLTKPAAVITAAVTAVRRHVAEPGMPRMSPEWLNSHDRFAGSRYNGR